MKKILQLSLIAVLFFSFIGLPQNVSADPLVSQWVKQNARQACGYYARVSPTEEEVLSSEDINLEESISTLNSNFTSEIRTSAAGSRIVLPAISGYYGFGYCHIFERHMEMSNNNKKYKVDGTNQFRYAYYPGVTMDIIMQVIDGTTLLVPEKDGKYSKSKYSKSEGQNVKVILRKGKDVTNGGNFSAYDWVVVTAYPIGF